MTTTTVIAANCQTELSARVFEKLRRKPEGAYDKESKKDLIAKKGAQAEAPQRGMIVGSQGFGRLGRMGKCKVVPHGRRGRNPRLYASK